MALRLDTHEASALAASKDIADQVVARIAKLVMEKVRAENRWRAWRRPLSVIAAGSAAAHMLALAERLRRELDEAAVTYRKESLKIRLPASAWPRWAEPAIRSRT